jgi:tetratricopeptide (TPR) repeat protein
MDRHLKTLLILAAVLPACDQFVCSQQRIKAMELNNKGVDQFKNNLYESAERDFKAAITMDPSYEMSHYNLGKVLQKQRKWDKAAEAFEAAVQRAPSNANYHYDLGEAYLEAKKVDDAEKALKKATELDPSLFKAHWRLGLVYLSLERSKDADQALRKAIEANARLDKPFVALGHLYLDYDANKEAEQVFAECLRANELSAECFNGHGLALKELKQYETAASEFKKALEVDSGLEVALYNCGMTYADWYEQSRANDHKDKAREFLQKFVSSGGGKDGGFGYVKAANDKLYALSGS